VEGMATGSAAAAEVISVCVPTTNLRGGGFGVGCFFTTVSVGADAGSRKTFCRKSAIAFVRVLRLISVSPIFLRNLTYFS